MSAATRRMPRLSEQIQGAVALGRFQNPTECEHIRRLPSGQLLRAAVAEELECPKRKAAAASPSASTGDQGDQDLAARRSAAARIRPELWTAAPADFFLT